MGYTVYTKPECGQCENVKRWLKWAEIPFEVVDGTEPDILIIYEAEVDGVKVYPSVVKESE